MSGNPLTSKPAKKESPPITRIAYSVDEAAIATGLSRSSLYLAMQAGELEFGKFGSRRIIPADGLEAFIAHLKRAR